MMPSLFSAVSGLKSNQEMMDVIGNNIANVNTPGFKSSSVNFADLLSQTMKGASLPTSTTGGTNPIQIGQGTNVASVDTNFTNGSLQQTGNNTDLGINGDGLFILGSGGNQYYTRDGDFSFDASGNLVSNANGMNVQGWMANSSGTITTSATPTNIGINLNASTPAQATSSMVLSGNLNSDLNNGTLLFSSGTGSFPFSVTDGDAPPTTGNWQLSFSPAGPFNTWNWTITDANTGSTLDAGTLTLDSTTGKITNMTTSQGYTGTVGTSTGDQVVANNTNIIQGVNDNIDLSLNGGAATSITIPPGSYATPAELVTAVNKGITNSTLSGSVTAALDGTGRLAFTNTSGSNAVKVSSGTDDASGMLGFTSGVTADVTTSTQLCGVHVIPVNANAQYVNLTLAGVTKTVNLFSGPYAISTGQIDNTTTTQSALQSAFDANFGTGAVTVGINGTSLTFTSNIGPADMVTGTNTTTVPSNNITVLPSTPPTTPLNLNADAGIGTFTIHPPIVGSLPNAFSVGGGTSTGDQVVANSTTITTGTNDNIDLAVNGGAATSITIPPGTYTTPDELVTAVNTGIANSTLSGSVTAALDSAGQPTFTSTSGPIVVSAGTNDASTTLGYAAYVTTSADVSSSQSAHS